MSYRIALVGNPNSGKTTLFNALTGEVRYVGNWAGVTVDKKEGRLKHDASVVLCDLPGVYSLSPYTPEERVTHEHLLNSGRRPDCIINLVDGTNLERNLYLTGQCLELGIPMVVALTMMDAVRRRGDRIDRRALSAALGCAVVETAAACGEGLDELVRVAVETAGAPPPRVKRLGGVVDEIDDDDEWERVADARYRRAAAVTASCAIRRHVVSHSERIDAVVTNRVLALPLFAAIMLGVYFVAITLAGGGAAVLVDHLVGGAGAAAAHWLAAHGVSDALVGLVTDGIMGGCGTVLGFVPQLAALFMLLTLLEEVGYMSRAAFIMDRIMRRFGLSGRSFIPLLLASGCGVPAVMATRTIGSAKERRLTAICATFIPCGAKLPLIALVGGELYGGAWWVAPLMYMSGLVAAALSCILLGKMRCFSDGGAPFLMEMPPYRLPRLRNVSRHVGERVRSFVTKAGTVVLLASVAVWCLQRFGVVDGALVAVPPEKSLLAAIGGAVASLFAPLGFGRWEAVVATLTGLVAKEQAVATLGVLSDSAAAVFDTPIAGLSFLLFNLLCAPCVAAMAAVRRELGTRWALFAAAWQTLTAYAAAFAVFFIFS